MQERREFARVEDDAIRFRWPGSRRDEPVANLSRSGAKLFTVRSAPVGSLVELELLREGAAPLALLATVRRVERPTRSDREASLGMSIEFRDIEPGKEAVLVEWTGDHSDSDSVSGDEDDPVSGSSSTTAVSSDHRGKLWEDASPSVMEEPVVERGDLGGSVTEPSASEDAESLETGPVTVLSDAARSEVAAGEGDASGRIQDLEARLMRAESLAAEALVQLARAERRVEQLESQGAADPEQPKDSARPYAGGDDGTSVLEDPLVAELFSRPVGQPVQQAPDGAESVHAEGVEASQGSSGQPAIEMIERVEDGERRRARIDRVPEEIEISETPADTPGSEERVPTDQSSRADVDEVEAASDAPSVEAPSKGPISGAVAAFHRLAEDPLETVGFSRTELLGELAEQEASVEAEEAPLRGQADPQEEAASAEDEASASGFSDDSLDEASEDEWSGGESLALEVSEEEVFVEVVGLDEDDPEEDPGGDGVTADASTENDSADAGPVAREASGSWPDLEIEEPDEENGPAAGAAAPADEFEDLTPEASAATDQPDSSGAAPEAAESRETAAVEDATPVEPAIEPNGEGPMGEGLSGEGPSGEEPSGEEPSEEEPRGEPVETVQLQEAPAEEEPDETEAAEERSVASAFEQSAGVADDDASAFESSALDGDSEPPGPSMGETEAVDEEIDVAISASMVEEIAPAGVESAVESAPAVNSDAAPEPDPPTESAGTERGAGGSAPAQELTLAELPTCSEMVEAMRSGRIVRTARFNRLEPVSRLDIEISDLLRSSERLDDLEAKTRGRIAPAALHRVLFVFFERGLIAVEREG